MTYIPIRNVPPMSADNTAYWEGFLSDGELDFLSSLADSASCEGEIGLPSEGRLDHVVRSSKITWIEPTEDTLDLWHKISFTVARINATYFQFDLDGFHEPGQITLYDAKDGGHYDWHQDSNIRSHGVMRKLTCVLLLNETAEFEGGDLLIKSESDVGRAVQMRRGRMWFFPSWMLHKVTPVISGRRKTLVLWAGGAPFR